MKKGEPRIFQNWSEYTKQRQIMIAAALFRANDWDDWEEGHAKLFSIFLWLYEGKKQIRFKYSKTLKKSGYSRTHNYRLLNMIVKQDMLAKEGNGNYRIPEENTRLINKAMVIIKNLDNLKEGRGDIK